MTGHTTHGVPYALPGDDLIDYPTTSVELAAYIDARGRELVNYQPAGNSGPTGVSASGSGDSLYDLGSLTVRNVPHWVELSLAVGASPAAVVGFQLYEGLPGAPGAAASSQMVAWLDGARPLATLFRSRFTPAAGTRNYHLRWINLGGAATFTIWHANYPVNVTVREALR